MQAKVDKLYPAGPRKKAKKRRKLTASQQIKKLKEAGWIQAPSMPVLGRLAAAGIRVQRVRDHSLVDIMAPGWAADIASLRPSKLVACKKDIKLRRALLVELALEEDDENKRRTA